MVDTDDVRRRSCRVATVKGMVVAGGVIDVVGRKNEVVCWGVNMVTWRQSFNGLR